MRYVVWTADKFGQVSCGWQHGPFESRAEAERMAIELAKRKDINPPIRIVEEEESKE